MRERSIISKSLERYPSTSAGWIVWHRVHFHHSIEQGAWMAEKTLLEETGLPRSTLHRAINGLLKSDLMRVTRLGKWRTYCLPVDDKNVITGRWSVPCESGQCRMYVKTGSHSCQAEVPPVDSQRPTDGTPSLTRVRDELSNEPSKEESYEPSEPDSEMCIHAQEPETPSEGSSKETDLVRSWLKAEFEYETRLTPEYQEMTRRRNG